MELLKNFLSLPFLVFATSALAQPVTWGTAGGWDILIDTDGRHACYATRTLEDGSAVFIGFDPGGKGGYFSIYNPGWTHIEEGQEGLVEFDFGRAKFAGEAVGTFRDGVPGGYAFFNNPAFADAFARYETVQITGSKGASFSMALSGTHKAVTAVRQCQTAQPPVPDSSE